MIANVPEKRMDGGSSFLTLFKYICHQVDEESGETRFRGTTWCSDTCLNANTSAKEMEMVAVQNPRVSDPVFHYILSWPSDEMPTYRQWRESVMASLSALGLDEHQAFAIAHQDTETFHVHVMANRVHPETYRAHAPEWSHRTLHRICRELEKKYGWQEDHGLYRWDDTLGKPVRTEKHLLEEWRQEREQSGRAATGKAAKMEHYGDSETLETYCKAEPAKRLNALMKQGEISWQTIHSELALFGLILHKSEKGGFTVSDDAGVHVKASKVFRNLFSGKQAQAWRESALGEFSPPSGETLSLSLPPSSRYKKRVSRRDPLARQIRKEERRQVRQELLDRYNGEKKAFEKKSLPRFVQEKAIWAGLMKESAAILKDRKKQIRASGKDRDVKQIEIGLAIFEHEERCSELKEKIRQDKEKSRFVPKDEWMAQEAEKGDEAAIAWLRGQHHARQRKKKQEEPASIRPAVQGQFDPKTHTFGNLKWVVNRNQGTIEYQAGGKTMFVDTGPRIDVKTEITDGAILAALKLARGKYGQSIEATGSEQLLQRIAEVAAKNRLDVVFTSTDMQERVRRHQEIMEAERRARLEKNKTPLREKIPSSPVSDEEQEMRQLEEIAKGKIGNAKVKPADTQDGMRTVGIVSAVTDRFIMQHVGQNAFRVHRKELLGGENVTVGQNLRITYGNGKGIVADRDQEQSRPRSR